MPQLQLRVMTAEEFVAYRAHLVPRYAAEKVKSGDWPATDAEQRAGSDFDELLPAGPDTPGMVVRVAVDGTEARVGHVWVALDQPSAGSAWIYDIEVAAERRGQGFGRALLTAAEAEAAEHGIHTIGLHVFGGNRVARGLYQSAGWVATSVIMRKELV
jgi:ribosomal protein S18 acetylase RimI-like enzyme